MIFKLTRITLFVFEKIVQLAGTILFCIANILIFERNQQIIHYTLFWALLTSTALVLILYFNIKDIVDSLKGRENIKSVPKYFAIINIALIAFLFLSFSEMVLTEYFAPVGGYESIIYLLIAASLCYILKLLVDCIKLFCCNRKVRYLKKIYFLFAAFYMLHGIWIINQNDFMPIGLKNRSSINTLFSKDLSSSEEFLGHKAYALGTTAAPYGFLIYEPEQKSSGNKFPLLIFLHGGDETGNSEKNNMVLSKAAKHGPSRYIKHKSWNPPTPMIVVSPQTTDGWWRPEMVHEFIGYLIENYPIDKSRIYLTGLSRGGTGSFDYINKYGNESYVAAMLPVATDAFVVHSGEFDPSQFKNTPVWLLINDKDKYVADYKASAIIVEQINNFNQKSLLTVFPKYGHDSWTYTYTLSGQGLERDDFDPFNKNVYEWLLQFKKNTND